MLGAGQEASWRTAPLGALASGSCLAMRGGLVVREAMTLAGTARDDAPGSARASGRRHVVLGTAGHVDHGKTTLVKALTGIDTDRLPEEKLREMTIDLGFARVDLPSGRRASIIDVPGHERFVGNMLAGATGMDLVMMVVAADEGVMPQTVEHLDILDLLDVAAGIVVLTKADLVDEEMLEIVEEEVRAHLAGTFLEAAPVVPVSARTGRGLPALLAECDRILDEVEGKFPGGPARLAVDRAFTVAGFGTVITGTLLSGRLSVDQRLELLPESRQVRVRALEVHGERRAEAWAGERVAVNLAGLARAEVARGDVLATPEAFGATSRFDGELRYLARNERPLKHRQRVHLHTGTSEVVGRVLLLDGPQMAPGAVGLIQFQAEREMALGPRDRFIIRSYSPVETIGGGLVIDARPPLRRRRPGSRTAAAMVERLQALRRGDPEEITLRLMHQGVVPVARGELSRRIQADLRLSEVEAAELLGRLVERGAAVAIGEGSLVMTREAWAEVAERVTSYLAGYHERWSLRAGASRDEVRLEALQAMAPRDFAALLVRLEAEKHLAVAVGPAGGDRLALPGFGPHPTADQAFLLRRVLAALEEAGAAPPSPSELSGRLRSSAAPSQRRVWDEQFAELLRYMVAAGLLVMVSEEMYFAGQAVRRMVGELRRRLGPDDSFTVSDFRQWIGTSRKYAVPLLEHFDELAITRRRGDVRIAGPAMFGTEEAARQT